MIIILKGGEKADPLRRSEKKPIPDYQQIRDACGGKQRTLGKLKMGKQSASGKAIEAFIKELEN